MNKRYSLIYLLFLLLSALPVSTTYAMPNMPVPPTGKTIEPSEGNNFADSIYSEIGGFMTPFYGWAVDFLTISFVIGTIAMILSIMFKNGQWQKYAQSTMLTTFIVMLLMRGVPIVILSIHSPEDVDQLLLGGVEVLKGIGIFIAVISIPISLLFKFGHHLIEHPKYHRWSRNLIGVAVLMTVLSMVVPWIFPQI